MTRYLAVSPGRIPALAVFAALAATLWAAWPAAAAEIPLPLPRPDPAARAAAASFDPTVPARKLFAARPDPAPMPPRAIGSYARGCLAGGKPLAVDGPNWQVIRLSRNRYWGHPALIEYLERLAADVPRLGWRGLMVGDMAQPRGGPMLTGHSSHQLGLDADIWLKEMPEKRLSRKQREDVTAVSMLVEGTRRIDPRRWTERHAALIRRAASDPAVARIFIHPAIKKKLCEWAGADRDWLRRIRPWYGHHYHFHVRLWCPRGLAGCKDQAAPGPGDGCGKELDWWLSDAPWKKREAARKNFKMREVMMSDLPGACARVLTAR